jgi:hypothetical protein
MTFDVRPYWPAAHVLKTFSGDIVEEHIQSGNMMLRQSINGVWQFDWYYQISNAVYEYLDVYPGWFGWKREVWTVPHREIFWGGVQEFGTTGRQCQTSGLFGQWGWQELAFYEILPAFKVPAGTYKDVLRMEYWQTWSNKPSVGAKMWMAPGFGQIRAEWTKGGAPTGYWMEMLTCQS